MKRSVVKGFGLAALVFFVGVVQAAGQEKARKVDEYGAINSGNELARIDNYAIELQNDPPSKGYIITYGGRKSTAAIAKARSQRVWKWLVQERGLLDSRLVVIDGGYREEPTTELWIVPNGATPPTATPTVVKPAKKPVKKKSGV